MYGGWMGVGVTILLCLVLLLLVYFRSLCFLCLYHALFLVSFLLFFHQLLLLVFLIGGDSGVVCGRSGAAKLGCWLLSVS